MRIRRIVFALLFMTFFYLQACAPVYVPSTHHTHMLDKKGELSGAVLTGTNGVDLQGAYAVSDHIGVAAAGSFGTINEEGSEDFHKHSYGEVALEYYTPFARIGRFELIGGGGAGSATSFSEYLVNGETRNIQASGNYNKLFAQANIGLETNWIETGLAMRLGHVSFSEFETTSEVFDGEKGTFFEPGAFARVGWKNVMVEAQGGVSALLAQEEDELTFQYVPFVISLGVRLNLAVLP